MPRATIPLPGGWKNGRYVTFQAPAEREVGKPDPTANPTPEHPGFQHNGYWCPDCPSCGGRQAMESRLAARCAACGGFLRLIPSDKMPKPKTEPPAFRWLELEP